MSKLLKTDSDKKYFKNLDEGIRIMLITSIKDQAMNSIKTLVENIEPFSGIIDAKNKEINRLIKLNEKLKNTFEQKEKRIIALSNHLTNSMIDTTDYLGQIKDLKGLLQYERKINITEITDAYNKFKKLEKRRKKLQNKVNRLSNTIDKLSKRADYKAVIKDNIKLNRIVQRQEKLLGLEEKYTEYQAIIKWLESQKLPTKLAQFKLMMERATKNTVRVQQLEERMLKGCCKDCGSNLIKFDGKLPLVFKASGEVINLDGVLKQHGNHK